LSPTNKTDSLTAIVAGGGNKATVEAVCRQARPRCTCFSEHQALCSMNMHPQRHRNISTAGLHASSFVTSQAARP
jgi:hypothetical protein